MFLNGLKHPCFGTSLRGMKDQQKPSQADKDLAADTRPVPSQAEGDLETVEEDLEEKSKSGETTKK